MDIWGRQSKLSDRGTVSVRPALPGPRGGTTPHSPARLQARGHTSQPRFPAENDLKIRRHLTAAGEPVPWHGLTRRSASRSEDFVESRVPGEPNELAINGGSDALKPHGYGPGTRSRSTSRPRDGRFCRGQAWLSDPKRLAMNELRSSTSSAHRETAGVVVSLSLCPYRSGAHHWKRIRSVPRPGPDIW